MQRRSFIQAGAAATVLGSLPPLFPRSALAQQLPYDPRPAGWRTFEITTRVELQWPQGVSRVWVPVPSVEGSYQKVIGNTWSGNGSIRKASDGKYGANMVVAEWSAAEKAPLLEVVSTFATVNRATDFGKRDPSLKLDAASAKFYLAPTELIPTDGIVRKAAQDITRGKNSELDKARAIYEWVVDNTFRDPKTRGCGVGDIKSMLETGNLSGKCADLNALYVGLARAAGLPARDVYGLRVVKSDFGYRSLGAGTPNVTRAQHCRAEVFLTGYGWVPVDPADVRKVVLEEKPQPTTLADPVVPPVRAKLFGAWEMNWLAYNQAHDVKLPGSRGPAIGFLMYPQAETEKERIDSLDPDAFKYTITAREIKA
jgi:transglutaminase-like putative cysteine protease